MGSFLHLMCSCTIKLEHLPPVNLVQHDPKLQQRNSTTVGIRKLFRENVVWPLKGSSLQINHERLPPQQLQQHHTTTTSCNCSFKSFHHVQGKKTTARLLVITTLVEWKWIEVVANNQIRYLWVSNLWMHRWSVLCRVSLLSEEGPTGVRSKHGKIRCIWRLFAHKYVWCTRTTFTSRDGLFINYYPANTDIILSKNAKYIGSYWERGRDDKHSMSWTSPLT